MANLTNSLLPSASLNVSALSRIFKSTTTSYKYLFLLSLIKLFKKSNFSNTQYKLTNIASEMLVIGWYPHTYFKLSFGLQDQIAKTIDSFQINANDEIPEKTLRIRLSKNDNSLREILRYVPFRLLSVFFEKELKGVQDGRKNQLIAMLSTQQFESTKPIYHFVKDNKEIIIHPAWVQYLTANYSIVEGWLLWHWHNYLQNKNPNIPAIAQKISPPITRISLKKETSFWRKIINRTPVKCIYSNTNISPKDISLDHFLPWSFVGHNQLWNLIPTQKTTNSAKGNRLPDLNIYLDNFIELQFQAITISKELLPKTSWEKIMECYILDLQVVDYEALCDKNILSTAFKDTLIPQYKLATRIGFSEGWTTNIF